MNSIGRVDATGGYHLLSMGTISPARRRLDPGRSTACEIAIDTETPKPLTPGEPRQREFAFRAGVNIVMYTLTGNYKADQVHAPALIERLGQ